MQLLPQSWVVALWGGGVMGWWRYGVVALWVITTMLFCGGGYFRHSLGLNVRP